MDSIIVLWKASTLEIKNSFSKYFPFYCLFLFVSLIEFLTDNLIPKNFESIKLIITISVFFLTIISSMLFLRTQKKDAKEGDFWYLLVPYLLYSIYYSFVGIVGIIFLFIPGILFYYAPLIATFHSKAPAFKTSYKLAKKNFLLAAFLSITTLLLEAVPMSFKFIQSVFLSSMATGFFSIIAAYVYMIIMIMTVKYYYEVVETV